MVYEYCIVNEQGRFIESYQNFDDVKTLKNVVKAIPPKMKEGFIAFWEKGAWRIKRKTTADEIDSEYHKKIKEFLDFDKIKEEVKTYVTSIPQNNGGYVSISNLINLLEIEHKKYKSIIIDKVINKQEIPKIYKIYLKELETKIKILKTANVPYSSFKVDEDTNEFDISDILDNKEDADLVLEKEINA